MKRSITIGTLALTVTALAVLAQPPSPHGGGTEPTPLPPGAADHPQVGHPAAPQRPSAQWPQAKPEDVASIDAIIGAYYASTAGKPHEARDWNRFIALFQPEARLIPIRATESGSGAFWISPTEFVEKNKNYLEKGGFVDREVARRVETFGHMAQVWSTYESRHSPDDPQPYSRGIASIQLMKDGQRWWIMNVLWDRESEASPIPPAYLQSPK